MKVMTRAFPVPSIIATLSLILSVQAHDTLGDDLSPPPPGLTSGSTRTELTEEEQKTVAAEKKRRLDAITHSTTAAGGKAVNEGGFNAIAKEEAEIQKIKDEAHSRNGIYNAQSRGNANDMCPQSATVDSGKYGCSSTMNLVQGSMMGSMMSMSAGSMATSAIGQSQKMNAMNGGTQTAALEAAANTQKTTGEMQLGIGGLNAALGALQLYKYSKHNQNARELASGGRAGVSRTENANAGNAKSEHLLSSADAGWMEAAHPVGKKIVDSFGLNTQTDRVFTQVTANPISQKALYDAQVAARNAEGQGHRQETESRMTEIGRASANEQGMGSQAALMGGIMSMMTGSQQLMTGGASLAAAHQMQKTIDALKKGSVPILQPLAGPTTTGNISEGPKTFNAPGTVSGDGSLQSQDPTTATPGPSGGPPNLGVGFNPNPMGSGLPDAQTPGKFSAGTPQGGSAGGGGVDTSGRTMAAENKQEEPQAKLASNGTGTNYGSGGAFIGGNPGGGGKGAEGGPDLSALMEKFLPKKDDPSKPPSSIMDFGNNGASDNRPFSILDKNANIFERVTDTYRDKQMRGNLGI